MVVRDFDEEMKYLEKLNDYSWRIKKGFQPDMNVEGLFYANGALEKLMFDELKNSCEGAGPGGFLPGVKQVANVAALPGIVGRSVGLPDIHSGYGFAIGNVAAFDMSDPNSIVSPGGVGFDINCGVRLLRTNLDEKDVQPLKEQLAQSLFDHIPVGVGTKGAIPITAAGLGEALATGMDWSVREGFAWEEDRLHCEENGRMPDADPSKGSTRAFGPAHPQVPAAYQTCGQPVLVGGSMGSCSYVLTGTARAMDHTFGSTCHGAGRALSRAKARKSLQHGEVLERLRRLGVAVRVASPALVGEEAPEAYKDVSAVVDTCHEAAISARTVRLRPLAVIKG